MAKQLWLLRHGDAVPHGSKPDPERELTPKGERQSRAAGHALARMSLEFAACYASPKLRACQTAELACERLGVPVQTAEVIAGDFTREDADELLLAHDDGALVLVVGHEPDFSQIVHDYTGARIDFKKGGIAAIKAGSPPELVVLLRPAELEAMAGGEA